MGSAVAGFWATDAVELGVHAATPSPIAARASALASNVEFFMAIPHCVLPADTLS
jgi:hypothetical protein